MPEPVPRSKRVHASLAIFVAAACTPYGPVLGGRTHHSPQRSSFRSPRDRLPRRHARYAAFRLPTPLPQGMREHTPARAATWASAYSPTCPRARKGLPRRLSAPECAMPPETVGPLLAGRHVDLTHRVKGQGTGPHQAPARCALDFSRFRCPCRQYQKPCGGLILV